MKLRSKGVFVASLTLTMSLSLAGVDTQCSQCGQKTVFTNTMQSTFTFQPNGWEIVGGNFAAGAYGIGLGFTSIGSPAFCNPACSDFVTTGADFSDLVPFPGSASASININVPPCDSDPANAAASSSVSATSVVSSSSQTFVNEYFDVRCWEGRILGDCPDPISTCFWSETSMSLALHSSVYSIVLNRVGTESAITTLDYEQNAKIRMEASVFQCVNPVVGDSFPSCSGSIPVVLNPRINVSFFSNTISATSGANSAVTKSQGVLATKEDGSLILLGDSSGGNYSQQAVPGGFDVSGNIQVQVAVPSGGDTATLTIESASDAYESPTSDTDGNNSINWNDRFRMIDALGSFINATQAPFYNPRADTDVNGLVDMSDYFAYVAIFSTTACPADYNSSATVTTQDLFDFIAAWFVGGLKADFNGDGTVSVQDNFDFIAAWFAGC